MGGGSCVEELAFKLQGASLLAPPVCVCGTFFQMLRKWLAAEDVQDEDRGAPQTDPDGMSAPWELTGSGVGKEIRLALFAEYLKSGAAVFLFLLSAVVL